MNHHRLPGRPRLGLFLLLLGLACLARVEAQGILQTNPATAGLWMGDVVLNRVGGVNGVTANPDATASELRFRILLHADAGGRVRLLKDVVVAKRDTPVFDAVLVSDPAKLSGLDVERNKEQAVAGRRFTAVGYDFAGRELPFSGGIGAGYRCEGQLVLSNTAPTNPFRHAFHPDHANTGARAITVRRAMAISFPDPQPATTSTDDLTGAYEETVQGLAGAPVTVRGSVRLRRISRTSILNQ